MWINGEGEQRKDLHRASGLGKRDARSMKPPRGCPWGYTSFAHPVGTLLVCRWPVICFVPYPAHSLIRNGATRFCNLLDRVPAVCIPRNNGHLTTGGEMEV